MMTAPQLSRNRCWHRGSGALWRLVARSLTAPHLVDMAVDGALGANQYGPSPKPAGYPVGRAGHALRRYDHRLRAISTR
jgi:hypothetical protein